MMLMIAGGEVPGPEVRGTQTWVPKPGYPMRDTRCGVRDAGYTGRKKRRGGDSNSRKTNGLN